MEEKSIDEGKVFEEKSQLEQIHKVGRSIRTIGLFNKLNKYILNTDLHQSPLLNPPQSAYACAHIHASSSSSFDVVCS